MSDYENMMCHAAEIVSAIQEATPPDDCLLTKREVFALHLTAAMIAAAGAQGSGSWGAYALDGVNAADALIDELRRPPLTQSQS